MERLVSQATEKLNEPELCATLPTPPHQMLHSTWKQQQMKLTGQFHSPPQVEHRESRGNEGKIGLQEGEKPQPTQLHVALSNYAHAQLVWE